MPDNIHKAAKEYKVRKAEASVQVGPYGPGRAEHVAKVYHDRTGVDLADERLIINEEEFEELERIIASLEGDMARAEAEYKALEAEKISAEELKADAKAAAGL